MKSLVPFPVFLSENSYVGPVTRKVLERLYSCDNDLRSVPLSILAPGGNGENAFPEEAPTIVSVQPLSVIVGQVTLNGAEDSP